MGHGDTGWSPRQRGGLLVPPMRAWLTQPHGRHHKEAPPQPCALTQQACSARLLAVGGTQPGSQGLHHAASRCITRASPASRANHLHHAASPASNLHHLHQTCITRITPASRAKRCINPASTLHQPRMGCITRTRKAQAPSTLRKTTPPPCPTETGAAGCPASAHERARARTRPLSRACGVGTVVVGGIGGAGTSGYLGRSTPPAPSQRAGQVRSRLGRAVGSRTPRRRGSLRGTGCGWRGRF